MADIDNFPFQLLARFFSDGSVVPFLGAGVNLCDRPAGVAFEQGKYLPSGWELTKILAEDFFYPQAETLEIMRVAEFVAVAGGGPAELYKRLRTVFNADYPTTTIHQAIAALPAGLAAKGYGANHQLIVTTNYDDVMERAFTDAGEPYDVVVYVMDEDQQGQLIHISDGKSRPIRSNQDTGLPFELSNTGQSLTDFRLTRSLILKVHGAIDRNDASKDSYVITEDNYVDYLARRDITKLLPKYLLYKLTRSHLLFLGYSITDWNLRVVLNRLWSQRKPNEVSDSWAIQREPKPLDVKYWQRKGVQVSNIPLADFATWLDTAVQATQPAG